MAISLPSVPRVTNIGWRTPAVIVACGCMISLLSFGPRASLGFFLTPMSQDNGWDRDVFGLALAIQNILWGVGQPFAGAIADRYGTVRVLCAGGLFYALGLTLMAYSTTPGMLDLGGGVFVGFGLAGLLVLGRARRVRQAAAGALALAGLRRRHGGGLVRPVSLFAARRLADGRIRLADHAADLRRWAC